MSKIRDDEPRLVLISSQLEPENENPALARPQVNNRNMGRGQGTPPVTDDQTASAPEATIEIFHTYFPETVETLASLAGLDASVQDQAVNLLPLGTRLMLEAYGVVNEGGDRHLVITEGGAALIDAAAAI